jgi:hypothetical protein
MITNAEILKERVENFNLRTGPRTGDFINLPYGLLTRITYVWENHVQTGGTSFGQYYMGGNYLSYSGPLDRGVLISDLILSPVIIDGNVWIFDEDIQGANRGITFSVPMRVYNLKENADVSGCPQVEKFKKARFL